MQDDHVLQKLTIYLRRPPSQRWHLTPAQCQQARELLTSYKADLGLSQDVAERLSYTAKDLVRADYWEEMESLAAAVEARVSDVVLGNLYYDCLKVMLGCTAFAVETEAGILHARNLDWWTENAALSRHTTVCHFVGGPVGEFTTVGWPGFIGAFSGVATGRFAVTLNAVLSLEPAELATPVVLLLRTVLEEARSFDEALSILAKALLPCDCLLLLTGTRAGEMAVIERTPSHHAIRQGRGGYICVTNDYHQLRVDAGGASSEILSTSCRRFERVESLIGSQHPRDSHACFEYLSDPEVRMRITVQQMVFRAAAGEYWIKLPSA